MSTYKSKDGKIVDAVQLEEATSISTGTGELAGVPGSWVITDVDGDKSIVEEDAFEDAFSAFHGKVSDTVEYKNIYTGDVVSAEQVDKDKHIAVKDELGFEVNRHDWLITDGKVQFPVNDADFIRTYMKVVEKPEPKPVHKEPKPKHEPEPEVLDRYGFPIK